MLVESLIDSYLRRCGDARSSGALHLRPFNGSVYERIVLVFFPIFQKKVHIRNLTLAHRFLKVKARDLV